MEKSEQHGGGGADNHGDKFIIKIPSYQEVIESSQPKTTSSSSLFNPSPSFSQAFNFIKKSDFYSPPPPAAPSPCPPAIPPSFGNSQGGQSESSSASSTQQSTSASAAVGVTRNSILVSHRQKGNPLLKYIRNVRWSFAEVVCDYQLGQNSCAIYLSLRYHLLHPDYLYFRIRELQKNFRLRVVLCYVDVEDVVKPLLEVTRTALLHDCTLLCGWSLEECGRYLETIKVYENKPADLIQGQMDTDYLSRLNHALTSIRSVNKTDVVTLGSTFGSLSHIMDAPMEDLARCPGIGEQKVKRLYDTFHEPFKRVLPNPVQPVPENPVINNDVESSSRSKKGEEANEEAVNASKRKKKEPEITIKSALTAAFSKYSHRIGKNKTGVQDDKNKDINITNKKQKNINNEAAPSTSN